MPSEWTRTVVVAGALVAAVLAIVLVRSSAKSEKDQESADPQAERGGDDNKASTASASSTRSVPPTGPASDTLPSPADNATAALKTKFEEAQRLAAQFNKTEFARAAEYYTECIDICNVVQEYGGKLLTLYNNRSAMYEKLNALESCEADLAVLFALSPDHTKGRIRKARVLEKQGMLSDAMCELCFLMLASKQKNPNAEPPFDLQMMQQLLTQLVNQELPEVRAKMRAHRGLPARHVLREYFASFNLFSELQAHFDGVDPADVALEVEESMPGEDQYRIAAALLASIQLDMCRQKFSAAFEKSQEALKYIHSRAWCEGKNLDDASPQQKFTIAGLLDTVGQWFHIYNDLDEAEPLYRSALALYESLPMDNATKHALCATCIHIGGLLAESISQGNSALVQEMFDRAVELEPENSMVYVNRAAMWQILKTEDRALQDTERALQLDPSHVAATLKMIVSIMREPTPEKLVQAKAMVERLHRVHPTDVQVLCQVGELRFIEGDFDGMKQVLQEAAELEPDNPLPYVHQGTLYLQLLQMGGQYGQEMTVTPDDVHHLFDKALHIDPMHSYALTLKGQLAMNLTGSSEDSLKALELFERATALTRDPDELEELVKLKIMAKCQYEAALMLV